ncbi:hypothetical protein ACXPVS_08985 [Pseudomonas sp. Ma2-10]
MTARNPARGLAHASLLLITPQGCKWNRGWNDEDVIERILNSIKPKAAYFSEQDGMCGEIFVVDVQNPVPCS